MVLEHLKYHRALYSRKNRLGGSADLIHIWFKFERLPDG